MAVDAADRKEVKVKLNRDANQRIDFIWRRADGELSEQSCAEAIDCKLETDGTRPVRPAIPALRAPELSVCHRLTDGELSEQSCAELHRKEVKAKLNRDANQRIDFIWRRALRVSQTDGELSEQSCAELRAELCGGIAEGCTSNLHGGAPQSSSMEVARAAPIGVERAVLCRVA
ncbi:hypothetical protein Bbelb_085880 [Branchiostoma belcheri]|nr:hypothetical protein Bbelb_085880 [Branchiostoma belcheri]